MCPETPVLRITVNGREAEVPEGSTVLDAVASMGFDSARIAVEIDGCVCPRSELPVRRVRGGERMEVVSFVGGGRCPTTSF
ncbi:MAG: sulfur carrier protein ThiS [Thermoplasmata archaeon]|nr:sulfur carrier protein ThiS [Thermoplasmata archaeon]